VALLLILFALLGFLFLGTGSGSTGAGHLKQSSSATGSATATGSASSSVTQSSVRTTNGVTRSTCIVVTWKAGQPAHKRACHKAPAKP
jgi:hypothetical protein